MNILQKAERILKSSLKEKKRLTRTLVITFLITGSISNFGSVKGKDVEYEGSYFKGYTYISDIEKPNEKGISHNKYDQLYLNKDNLIFNNSVLKNESDYEKSKILNKYLDENKKLEGTEAKVIIAEVDPYYETYLGKTQVEIYGKSADLIIANESGFTVNGAKFHNVNSLTLNTGKYDKEKNEFNISKGNIEIKGNGLDIEGNNKELNIEGQNIYVNTTLGSKENKGLNINLKAKNGFIETSKYGSMYGNRILLKVEGENSGIKHNSKEIVAADELVIDSATGDIKINDVKVGNNLIIKAKNEDKLKFDGLVDVGNKFTLNLKEMTAKDEESYINNIIGQEKIYQRYYDTKREKEELDKQKDKSKYNLLNILLPNKVKVGDSIGIIFGEDKDDEKIKKFNKETPIEDTLLSEEEYNKKKEELKKETVEDREKKYKEKVEKYKSEKIYVINTRDKQEKESFDFDTEIEREKEKPREDGYKLKNLNEDSFKVKLALNSQGKIKLYENQEDKATLIDINAAKHDGISHNYFSKFSVDKDYSILLNNNSEDKDIISQALSKNIRHKNENLYYGSAKIILNEVLNTNEEATNLAGKLELLGESADVIIANENGIIVNGGEFFNIDNLSLSTGKFKKNHKGDYEFENNRNNNIEIKSDIKVKNILIESKDFTVNDKINFRNARIYTTGNATVNKDIYAEGNFRINANGEFINKAKIFGEVVSLKGSKFTNEGNAEIEAASTLYLASKDNDFINKGNIASDAYLTIRSNNKIINDGKIEHKGTDFSDHTGDSNIFIQGKDLENKSSILSKGGISLHIENLKNEKTATIKATGDIRGNIQNDLNNHGKILSDSTLYLEVEKNLVNKTEVNNTAFRNSDNQAVISGNRAEIYVKGNVKNEEKSLMIGGKNGIRITAENITNDNSVIYSSGAIALEANKDIENKNGALIKAQGKGLIVAEKVTNNLSNIETEDSLAIRADELKNLGESTEVKIENGETKEYSRGLKIKEAGWKSWYNGYYLKLTIPDEKAYLEAKGSLIRSGANLTITGKKGVWETGKKVLNKDSAILANGNIYIDAETENVTTTHKRKAIEILKKINVNISWDTSSLVNSNTVFESAEVANKNLYEILKSGELNNDNGRYFELLKNANIPELDKVLSLVLGKDWKYKNRVDTKFDEDKEINYYSLRNKALISAGKNIVMAYGSLKNSDQAENVEGKGYRDSYDADTFYERVIEVGNGSETTIQDTINKVLPKDNGIYKENKDGKYKYVTSKYIKDKDQYKGLEYLEANVNKELRSTKDSKVIGDEFYQNNMINNMLSNINDKNLKPSKETVDNLLTQASIEGNRLGLKIGKSLTQEEVNKLEKDIVWYVETEIKGAKVLTPVVYLSKKTEGRIKEKDKNNFSSVVAGENIITSRIKNIENKNSQISSENNVILSTEKLTNQGNKGFDTNISAKNKVIIDAEEDVRLELSRIEAQNGISLLGNNVEVKASEIKSEEGNVNIRAKENLNISDKITEESTSTDKAISDVFEHSYEQTSSKEQKSIKSKIEGKNVSLIAAEDVNIKASDVEAKKVLEINGKDVNISSSISKKEEKGNKTSSGFGEIISNTSFDIKKEQVNKSNIKSGVATNIEARKDLNIKGSNIHGEEYLKLQAKENINIENETRKIEEKIAQERARYVSYENRSKEETLTKVESSNITSKGALEVLTDKGNIKIKGSNIVANSGNINSGKDINIEVVEETYTSNLKDLTISLSAGGGAGVTGLGVEGKIDSIDGISSSITNEYSKEVKNRHAKIANLANADAGVKVGFKTKDVQANNFKNSNIIIGSEGADIIAKKAIDLGGLNVASKGNVNIKAGEIKSTKKTNTYNEKSHDINVTLKQSGNVNSSILDAVNTVNEIATDVKNNELNETLTALKVAGAATNLLFNDSIGSQSKQSVGISYTRTGVEKESINKTNINSDNNVSIETTKGDITLNNVDVKAGDKLKLKSEKDINLIGGKNRTSIEKINIEAEVRGTQSAGVSALFGANSQLGAGGNVGLTYENNKEKTTDISKLSANNVEIESKESTKLEGAKVYTNRNAKVKVGKDLIIKSTLDEVDNKKIKSEVGGNISLGVASNTLLAGRISGNASAGYIYEQGNKISEQSGITSNGSLDVDVKNNLELEAGVLGSKNKKGKLNVQGEIRTKNITTEEKAGGAIVGGSGGLTGEIGADIEIGDSKEKQQISKSVLGFENVNSLDVETNLDNAQEITKDSFKKGGAASLSFSVKDSKNIIQKAKNLKNKISKNKDEKVTKDNPIYESLETKKPLANRPLPEVPGKAIDEKVEKANPIYEGLSENGSKQTIKDPNNSDYSIVRRVGEKVEVVDEKVTKDNPIYESLETKKALANRPLPEVPGKAIDEKEKSDGIYEEIKKSKDVDKYDGLTKEEFQEREKALQKNLKEIEEYEKELKAKKSETKVEKEVVKGFGNTSYIPKQLSNAEKEALFAKTRKNAENKDVQKEAVDKLKKIAQNSENIPKEHLLNKLNEVVYGYDNDTVAKIVEKSAENATKIVVPDTVDKNKLTNSDRKEIGKIFENVKFNESYEEVRKEVDSKIFDKLSKDPEFKKIMNTNLSGNEENLRKLFEIVSTAKKDAFKEVTGIEVEKPKLVLEDKKGKVKTHGNYLEDIVTMNIVAPIKSKSKKDQNKELLNTIIHELTHHDQAYLAKNKDNSELSSKVKNDANLFALNQELYITTDSHVHGYAKQPLEREAFKSADNLSDSLFQKVYKSDIDSKKLFEEAKKKAREKDSAKEAEKKLKIIAEYSKNIPKEHLLNAVEKISYGLSAEENEVLRKKSNEEGTKFVRPDTIEEFTGSNLNNMAKILRNIQFDEAYVELREKINDRITEKLDQNPEFHRLMKTKLAGNEENITKLFNMVEQVKRETLKELAGIDGKAAEIDVRTNKGALSLGQGYYDKGVVHTNIVPFFDFAKTQKMNNKSILNTIVHELTHHDQAELARNKDKNIADEIKNDAKLLSLNQVFYISPNGLNYLDYKNQPLEREAFYSGDKLGEKLTKLVDKGYTGGLREINEIEHLGGNNKNLETSKEIKTDLGNNALIYGLKDGRKELIEAANKADKENKNAILADSYIGDLNLGFEFSRLSNFAKKVRNNEVSEKDLDDIANFVDEGGSARVSESRSRINSANNEDNKRIITELLNNEIAKKALIRMDELNEKEKVLLEEIKKNEFVDIDYPKTSSNFTKEQNEVIEEYLKVKEGLNETRIDFFSEKTKLIAKETLERGGQIYFALDGLATDGTKFNKDKTVIDFNKLKDLFDPNHPFYNSVTSKELRYLYENFKDNPNLKFTIKKQVIGNPIKDLKIDNSKDESNTKFERRILPKLNIVDFFKNLFRKNKKIEVIEEDDDFEDIEKVRNEINSGKKEPIYSDVKSIKNEDPIYENVNPRVKKEKESETIYTEVKTKEKEPVYADINFENNLKKLNYEPIYENIGTQKTETEYSEINIKKNKK